MDNCCCGMPITLRGPRKAVRGKCERGHESVNAGAEVQTRARRMRKSSRAMSIRGSAFSTPWLQFHGGGAADVYIIIRVRACCGGESALNPPTSQPIPSRRPSLAPAQRHALAEHFRPPRSADARPRSPEPRPQAARSIPRSATLPPLPFRFGHKKTAPHSACAMPNVSVDRRCGRSFGLVSRALFAAVAGRWRVGVGLRPQPWALRSRRCGRVLRA